MSQSQVERWHRDLQELFGLAIQPIGIAFVSAVATGIDRIQRSMPPPSADGRTRAVPASCVFWIEATHGVFATTAEFHWQLQRRCPDTRLQNDARNCSQC